MSLKSSPWLKAFIAFDVLLILVVLWGVGVYNSLITKEAGVEQAWAQVEVQYQRRADLIPNLVETVSGAANFEQSVLVGVTEARTAWQNTASDPSATLEDQIAASNAFDSALSRLLVTVEAYPTLTATEGFQSLQVQLEGTENRIAVARSDFNEVVTDYNVTVRRFPTNFFANLFGFDEQSTFEAEAGSEVAPDVNFDF